MPTAQFSTTITTNTNTALTITEPLGTIRECVLSLFGTDFDSGTITLQASDDGTQWVAVPDAAYTAATSVVVSVGVGMSYRLVSSGGGGSMSIPVSWTQVV